MLYPLSLRERPAYRSIRVTCGFMAGFTLGIIALGTGAAISAITGERLVCLCFATLLMMLWGMIVPELTRDIAFNRSLPVLVEEHLDSHLEESDYSQLLRATVHYPAIRPWIIASSIKNGELTYRDAEPLFEEINQYLKNNWITGKAHLLTSQQKLQQLLKDNSASAAYPDTQQTGISVRTATAGRISITTHPAGDASIPPAWKFNAD